MTPSKILFCCCLAMIAGIAVESWINTPQVIVWVFLIIGVLAVTTLFFAGKRAATLFFCTLFLAAGITCAQIAEFVIASDVLATLNDKPETITLQGTIVAEPDIRPTNQKLKIKIVNTESVVLVTTRLRARYQYLDVVKVKGKLKTPMVTEEFNYQAYLQKEGIYSIMDYPAIDMVSQQHSYSPVAFLYEKILRVKSKLINSITDQFMPPHNFILQGMVFGNDGPMPKEIKDQFNATGLSHVTAVSGTNIVIIINMMLVFLLAMGFWRGQVFYLAILFIAIYLVLIGFPASGVRAALMGFAALLAQKLGRQSTGMRLLVLVASLMLLQNPLLLRYDVGFQLSFLASLGILYIKPLADIVWGRMPFTKARDKKPAVIAKGGKFVWDIFSITIAAQISTMPIIMYNFDRVSLVAPIANVLALPVVEALTILGFIAAIAGAVYFWLGFIVSLPCLALLWYFTKVLEWFSVPWAQIIVPNLSWLWVVGYYTILAGILWYFEKYKKPEFLRY